MSIKLYKVNLIFHEKFDKIMGKILFKIMVEVEVEASKSEILQQQHQ